MGSRELLLVVARDEGRATEADVAAHAGEEEQRVSTCAGGGCLAGWRRLVGRGAEARGTAAPGLGQRGGGAGRLGLSRRGFGAESRWLCRGLPRVGYRRRSLARAGEVGGWSESWRIAGSESQVCAPGRCVVRG